MKKSISIHVPEPCHEDWNKMTTTEKGKFCGVCTKEVFDFTKTTDEELVKKVYNNEKLCGRFKASQLNREIKLERKSGISLAPLAASFLLPFTLLSSINTKYSIKKEFASLEIGSLNNTNSNKLQITTIGKITDENGKLLFNVEILVKESGKSEVSGLKGDYKIISVNDVKLIFKKNGYVSQEVIIERISETINITLKRVAKITKTELKGKIDLVEKTNDSISETKQETTKINIKGTITDNYGFTLPGVNIIVKGTSEGTQTDFDGNYELIVDKNQIIVISYIGFETQEITLSNINNNIDLQMKEDEAMLGGMIVVGYSLSFEYSDYNPNKPHWRKTEQTSLDNEKEFSRIKRERKKESRKMKRGNK
ncbi:MAG: hypothetical protein COB12_06045 [Flavobacterium sp.]|nr:MAG: hypothetical protein COB12_06045 [Flavobacterium sp.]